LEEVLVKGLSFVCAALTLLAGAASAAPPSKGNTQGPLLVLDANSKVVGKLSTMGNTPIVYLKIDGVLTSYFLGAQTQGGYVDFERAVPLGGGNQLLFSSSNCTGTAHMAEGGGTRAIARQAIVLNVAGQSYLYVAQPVAPITITLGSVFQTGGCAPTNGTAIAVPVNAPVNLSTMFAEPYRVE
jgi:hypothetical protein